MANHFSHPLILIAVAFFIASPVTASSDAPFIVAHKKASLKRMKSGTELVTVSIDIYNEGSSAAYDVSLVDNYWPSDIFTVVNGNTSVSWDRLDVGAQLLHTFELETKVKGKFQGIPATIKFRVPTKAALQEAYSTPIFPLDILADRPPEAKYDWALKLLGKYGSLISVISMVTLFIYIVATPSKSDAAKGSKKRR